MSYTLIIYDPHRAPIFRAVLGSDEVQVTTLGPLPAEIPGMPGTQMVYLLDLQALDPAQMENLIEFAAQESQRDRDEVAQAIMTEGFPILAHGTAIRAINQRNFTLEVVFPSLGTGGG
jgi:hypothetical protein